LLCIEFQKRKKTFRNENIFVWIKDKRIFPFLKKAKRIWCDSPKNFFFDIEILKNVWIFLVYQTKAKRNELFFRVATKKRSVRSQKNKTLTSLIRIFNSTATYHGGLFNFHNLSPNYARPYFWGRASVGPTLFKKI
jgi:hypothetical protein